MTSIHESEPVAPEPVQPRESERIHQDEEVTEYKNENPPIAPGSGKILDTYV